MQERLISHYANYARAIDFTKAADAKAAPVFIFHVALWAVLTTAFGEDFSILVFPPETLFVWTQLLCFVIYSFLSIAGIVLATIVFVPNTSPARRSLIYFQDISEMSLDEFKAESRALDAEEIEEQLLDQIHKVGSIACAKMSKVRWSLICSAISLIPWVFITTSVIWEN